jgi:hypothetical protein
MPLFLTSGDRNVLVSTALTLMDLSCSVSLCTGVVELDAGFASLACRSFVVFDAFEDENSFRESCSHSN